VGFWSSACALALYASTSAWAHDADQARLQRGVLRIERTIAYYQTHPVGPSATVAPVEDPRFLLGQAEIDLALGQPERALRRVLAQLETPSFAASEAYVPALLLASEILERSGEDFGAMALARRALDAPGAEPEALAEAGARWFRLARRHQRRDGTLEVFEAMRAGGALVAADADLAGQARYELAFALRRQDRARARRILAEVDSGSRFGSRAAYLAGVLFVEDGNLSDAEAWFSALKDWPIPRRLQELEATADLEREVRGLAALSAGRLLYERGALEEAYAAYQDVPADTPMFQEACWEQAYLTLEMERPREALDRLTCYEDQGAAGERFVDARLFEASLLAHLRRYEDSLAAYAELEARFAEQKAVFDQFMAELGDASAFLFRGMERSALARAEAVDRGGELSHPLSPGPATLLGDAWTPSVDQAYRVERGVAEASADLSSVADRVARYQAQLYSPDAFPDVRFRRQNMRKLLGELDHLLYHLGEGGPSRPQAHLGGAVAAGRGSPADLRGRLRSARRQLQADLTRLEARSRASFAEAKERLAAVERELEALRREAEALAQRADPEAEAAARDALEEVRRFIGEAAMRAEVGVLDTFWLKKQQRTRDIERLLEQKSQTEEQARRAVESLSGW